MRARRGAALLAAVATVLALVTAGTPTAVAADPPSDPGDAAIAAAQAGKQAQAAELGALQAQAAALRGRIEALQTASDAASARYEQTVRETADALAAADRARAALTAARAEVERSHDDVQAVALDAYQAGSSHTGASALLFAGSGDVDFTLTAAAILADRQDAASSRLTVANVAAADADATRRGALARAETLQQRADVEQQDALTALETGEREQAALQGQLDDVTAKAAAAAAVLSGLLDQRAAYDAYVAEQRRQEQARQAAARAAADRAAAAERARAAGSGQGDTATGGGSVGGTAPPPVVGGSWTRPLTSYRISSCYCVRWGTFHRGVDLAAPLGTPIYAVGNGTVVRSGPASGFGNWVVIDHHDGTVSIYGHMRVLVARVGQEVGPGQLIAYVGTEGESTGPHLHFEVRVGGPTGPSTDPVVWLRRRGVTL